MHVTDERKHVNNPDIYTLSFNVNSYTVTLWSPLVATHCNYLAEFYKRKSN